MNYLETKYPVGTQVHKALLWWRLAFVICVCVLIPPQETLAQFSGGNGRGDYMDEYSYNPAGILILTTVEEETSVQLSWSKSVDVNHSYYIVYRGQIESARDSIAVVQRSDVPDTVFTDHSVITDSLYYYSVSSVNDAGEELFSSSVVNALPSDYPPQAISNFALVPSYGNVTLFWDRNQAADLLLYKVYRGTASTSYEVLDSVAAGAESTFQYVDTSVSLGQWYYYNVTAVDSAGNESNFTTELYGASQLAYERYRISGRAYDYRDDYGVRVIEEFGGRAVLAEWDNIKAEYGDTPEKITAFADGFHMVYHSSAAVRRSGNRLHSADRHYFYSRHDGNVPGNYLVHDHIQNNTLSLGSWSGTFPIMAEITPFVLPASLTALPNVGSVKLSWSASTDPHLSAYKIYKGISSENLDSLEVLSVGNLAENSFLDEQVVNGTTYYYAVSIIDEFGNESERTPTIEATPNVWDLLNLVAYYPFNGDVSDASGRENNGRNQGAEFVSDRLGMERSAARFNGVNQSIEAGPSSDFDFSGDFTLGFWARSSAQNLVQKAVTLIEAEQQNNLEFNFDDDSDVYGMWVYWNGNGSNRLVHGAIGDYTNGLWNQVYLSRDNGLMRLFINGNLVGQTQYEVPIGSSRAIMALGKRAASDSFFWNGELDDVRMYKRALSSQELRRLYYLEAPPSIPEGFSAQLDTADNFFRYTLSIHWNRNNDDDFMRYELFTGEVRENLSLHKTYALQDTSESFIDLERGKSYFYALRAVDSLGYLGTFSDTLRIFVPSEEQQLLYSTNFNDFRGLGLSATSAAGQLDSKDWAIYLSGGNFADFGQEGQQGTAFGWGESTGGVNSGGVYAFQPEAGNYALGAQPTTSAFNPGSFRLKIKNTTGRVLDKITVNYAVWIWNDSDRGNLFQFSYQNTDAHIKPAEGSMLSLQQSVIGSGWVRHEKSIDIAQSLGASDSLVLRWEIRDSLGTGSRDEFALDDVSIIGGYNPYPNAVATDTAILENNQVTLRWAASDFSFFDKYVVFWDTIPNPTKQIGATLPGNAADSSFVVTEFTPGFWYYYRIVVLSNEGFGSPYSAMDSIYVPLNPRIDAIVPNYGIPGMEIAIVGEHFGRFKGSLKIADTENEVVRWRPDSVYIVLPALQSADSVKTLLTKFFGEQDSSFVFSVKQPIEVWPGDTNNDGEINALDLFPIGRFYGAQDIAFPAGQSWQGYGRLPWSLDSEPARVFADANGDGRIDEADVLPIGVFYGFDREQVLEKQSTSHPLLATSDTVSLGVHISEISGGVALRLKNIGAAAAIRGISFSMIPTETSNPVSDVGMQPILEAFRDAVQLGRVKQESAGIGVAIAATKVVSPWQGELVEISLQTGSFDNNFWRFERIVVVDNGGEMLPATLRWVNELETTTSAELEEVPSELALKQNYPNPFNPSTIIEFQLPEASVVTLEVFDIQGRRIAVLLERNLAAGRHQHIFDATQLASGIYLYRMIAGDKVFVKRMVVVK